MSEVKFTFDRDAVLAALRYLQLKLPGLTRHQAFKLLYLADLLHLERYGRPITGDVYVAMDYGPVPSKTYDLIKKKSGAGPQLPPIQADLEELSRSDIRVLNEVIRQYGKHGFSERTQMTHDLAWQAARNRAPGHRAPKMPWSEIIKANFDMADELLRFLQDV